MKNLQRFVLVPVFLTIFLGLFWVSPGVSGATPLPGTGTVLPQNQDGTLAGALNGTGYYNFTDGPNTKSGPDAGFGPGCNSSEFNLPARWAYGPATVAIQPLFAVKHLPPADETGYWHQFNNTIPSQNLETFSFVPDYRLGDDEGDYYTGLSILANNVTYTSTATVTGVSKYEWSGQTSGGGSVSALTGTGNLNAVDGQTCNYSASSGLSGPGGLPEQWANLDVSVTLHFAQKPADDYGDYTLSLHMLPLFLGAIKLMGNFDTLDDKNHYVKILLGSGSYAGTQLWYREYLGPFSDLSMSWIDLAFPEMQPGWIDASSNLVLHFVFDVRIVEASINFCSSYFYMDYISASFTYSGNQLPTGLTLKRGSETAVGPTTVTAAYSEWKYGGWTPAGTGFTLCWARPATVPRLSFTVYSIAVDAYYNHWHAGDGVSPGIPWEVTGLSLGGGTVPLTISIDRRSANATIPCVSSFAGYNASTGKLSLQLMVTANDARFDNLTYRLAVNYSVGIPLSVNYTGGMGNQAIPLDALSAFSLWCTEGHFSGGCYVVSTIIQDGLENSPRGVFHTPQGQAGDLPIYNSSWNETISQPRGALTRNIMIAITTDAVAPTITSWYMPPLPDPGAPHVTVEEGKWMIFNVTFSAPSSGTGHDRAFLLWTNGLETWNMTMEMSVRLAYLDINASLFPVGLYNFFIVVFSAAGNFAATPTRTIKIVSESQEPVIDICWPGNDFAFASAFVINATVDDVNLITTSIRVQDIAGQTFYMDKVGPDWSSLYELSPGHGNWTEWEAYFPTLSPGWSYFRVCANDTRGNVGGEDKWVRFMVDRGAPTLVVVTPVNGTTYSAPPAVMVTLDDALSNVSLSYSINGTPWEPMVVNRAPPVTVSGTMPASVFNGIKDGPFVLAFLVEDGTAENFAMAVLYLRKDITRPWVNITSIAPGALLGRTLPAINFTVMDDSPVVCLVQFTLGSQVVSVPVPGEVGIPAGANRTAFSCTIPVLAWAPVSWEGPAILNISAMDSQGLPSYSMLPVLVDTIAPRVTILFPLDGDELVSAPSIRVSGVDGNYLSAWYSLDSGTNRYPIVGLPGTANFACDTTAWANAYAKEVYLLVAIEDAAGNVGVASITIVRADFLEYGPGPNPWIILDIFNQPWPVQVLFWAPVGLFAVYAFVARRRKQVVAPKREVAL